VLQGIKAAEKLKGGDDFRKARRTASVPPKPSQPKQVLKQQQRVQHAEAYRAGWQDPIMSQPAEPITPPAQQAPAVALQTPQTQAQAAPEASQVPRKQGVTDGMWDAKDAEAMKEAQKDKQTSSAAGALKVLLCKSQDELGQICADLGFPRYRGKQLYDGILNGACSPQDITNLPKDIKERLSSEGFTTGRSHLQHTVTAKDGTRKFLLQLYDGRVVETVGIPNDRDSRLTVCVSSQVGCPMRCTFCATGKGGFARNLLPHEIVDQVLTVQEQFGARVSNVVFMGMGEPLLTMRSVLAANKFLTADVGIGARHITISSVGVPNSIMKLASHKLQNTLAISIHAPTQELREQIVPSARQYPLEALLMECHEYFKATSRRISFEYTLLAGVNDSPKQAQQLAALLKRFDLRAHVNVIPYNPVDDSGFQRPTRANLVKFTTALDAAGVTNSTRITRGLEAAAACGQLRNQHQKTPVDNIAVLT